MANDGRGAALGVIGLGMMGGTLAGHLLERGPVIGYDRCGERVAEFVSRGGKAARCEAEVAASSEAVVLALHGGECLKLVCGEIAEAGREGLLVMDTATCDPEDSLAAADILAERGIDYVDAAVSGNAVQVKNRDVIFMLGGDAGPVAAAAKVLSTLSRSIYSVGCVGAGVRTKLVISHVLSINRAAVAEGLTVAEKSGLRLESTLMILRDSAAYSKAMDIWGDRMVAADHFPPASRMVQSHRDSQLITDHAARVGASIELMKTVGVGLAEAEAGGLADADNSSVMEVMRRRAGIGRISRR